MTMQITTTATDTMEKPTTMMGMRVSEGGTTASGGGDRGGEGMREGTLGAIDGESVGCAVGCSDG